MDTILPAELVEAARRVVDANQAAGRRIALAESCTGGLVCAALTEIPGSSEVLDAGYVTYSNEAKLASLHVSRSEEHTSELQSLMRNSSAVFCLKKKKKKKIYKKQIKKNKRSQIIETKN